MSKKKDENVHLEDLKIDPKNARRHNQRNLDMIEQSIRAVGPARSGVIDETGTILAGNGTAEALSAAGIHKVRIIDPKADEWVVVRRSGLTEEQKRILSVSDNRAAELATWDASTLEAQGIDLQPWFTHDEMVALCAVSSHPGPLQEPPEPQVDRADLLREKWQTDHGQLWLLGDHRVLCGDSTDAPSVARVMGDDHLHLVWTDPPYGVSYAKKNQRLNKTDKGHRVQTPIQNDDISGEDVERLCRSALALAADHAVPGAALYVAVPAGPLHVHFIAAVNASGFSYRHQLVWVKNTFVLGRSDYHYQHEPILYGWKDNGNNILDTPEKRGQYALRN